VRLTTSLLVRAKYFGCVVCRFHVAPGAELRLDRRHKQIVWSVAKPASINLRKWFLSHTGSIKPWFIQRETCRCAHHTFLLGFPTGWLSTAYHPPLHSVSRRILYDHYRMSLLCFISFCIHLDHSAFFYV
jgi:hypothetical protein